MIVKLNTPVSVMVARIDWSLYYDKDGHCLDTSRALAARLTPMRCAKIALVAGVEDPQLRRYDAWFVLRNDATWFQDAATGLWWPAGANN